MQLDKEYSYGGHMKLEKAPKVVAKLAKERKDENWAFRSFLKWTELPEEEIDAIVHKHYEDVSNQIDCCACGNCCRVALPTLEDDDVTRLAEGLKLSEEELTKRFLTRNENGDLTFNSKPCPLLSDKRCQAYEHRPATCKSYPHLQKNEFVYRLIQAVHNCSICPIVFNVFERLKKELWNKQNAEKF